MKAFAFILAVTCYLIFTIRYFVRLKKNTLFTGPVKTFHLLMIWLVPFIWILLLETLQKSTPGSWEAKSLKDVKPFSDAYNDASKAFDMDF